MLPFDPGFPGLPAPVPPSRFREGVDRRLAVSAVPDQLDIQRGGWPCGISSVRKVVVLDGDRGDCFYTCMGCAAFRPKCPLFWSGPRTVTASPKYWRIAHAMGNSVGAEVFTEPR